MTLIVNVGHNQWKCASATGPIGLYGRSPFSRSAPARVRETWLENHSPALSAYVSGLTSITLENPGWAVGQW